MKHLQYALLAGTVISAPALTLPALAAEIRTPSPIYTAQAPASPLPEDAPTEAPEGRKRPERQERSPTAEPREERQERREPRQEKAPRPDPRSSSEQEPRPQRSAPPAEQPREAPRAEPPAPQAPKPVVPAPEVTPATPEVRPARPAAAPKSAPEPRTPDAVPAQKSGERSQREQRQELIQDLQQQKSQKANEEAPAAPPAATTPPPLDPARRPDAPARDSGRSSQPETRPGSSVEPPREPRADGPRHERDSRAPADLPGREDNRRERGDNQGERRSGTEFRDGDARQGGQEFRRFDPERRESRGDERRDSRLDERFGRREERQGDRLIIREGDDRTIIREDGRTIIRHDETDRLRRRVRDGDVRVERRRGEVETVIRRPDGIEIVTINDEDGRLLRRIRRDRGRDVVLIDNTRRPRGVNVYLDLPPVQVNLPEDEYVVESDRATYEDIEQAFTAPPVQKIDRDYSLDEVRQNVRLRERVRSVDVNTVQFDFGQWTIPADQIPQLEKLARAIKGVINRDPNEVFLIEGHTDAVGSDIDNLSLSDRRAEEVAAILSESFQIPAENLVTQGYGEQYLKVDTESANAENRRVTARRITPLLNAKK